MIECYDTFLASKVFRAPDCGFDPGDVGDFLFDFQVHIVRWALRKGRSAIFADCGLGKTPMQLEWARHVCAHTSLPVLIVAPLAVSQQTRREGNKFDIPVNVCRCGEDIQPGINITNYEMLQHFTASKLGGIVLDESSILKNYAGHYRSQLTEFASIIPYRLACTATPAPNDLVELINHAEFLGVMKGKEIIALFFRQDGNTTHAWRLKGHAEEDFWRWLASWAVAVRMPSDLGYDNGRFILPPIETVQHTTDGHITEGLLFPVEAHTMDERRQARRESIHHRVAVCAELANRCDESWLIWCGLNKESELLTAAIPDAVEVKGSDDPETKTQRMLGFSDGEYRVLVTKPSIAGFGMNWQHCHNVAFVGLSDSWESYYQAVRRCWRFGQTQQVDVHVVVAETEGAVVANIQRKEREATLMMTRLVEHMNDSFDGGRVEQYEGEQCLTLPSWCQ